MYLVDRFEGREAVLSKGCDRQPLGGGFTPAELAGAVVLEIHGSSFSDPGPDFCEFRAFDVEGRQVAVKRVDGY